MNKDTEATVRKTVADSVEDVVRRAETDFLSAFMVEGKPAIEEPLVGVKAQQIIEEATRAILDDPAMEDATQLAIEAASSPDPDVRAFAESAVRDVSESLVQTALNDAMDAILGKP